MSSLIVTLSRKVGAGYGSDASLGQAILVAAEAVVEDYVRTLHYASGFFLFSTYYVLIYVRTYVSVYAFTKDFDFNDNYSVLPTLLTLVLFKLFI